MVCTVAISYENKEGLREKYSRSPIHCYMLFFRVPVCSQDSVSYQLKSSGVTPLKFAAGTIAPLLICSYAASSFVIESAES